eukprot:s1727_g2.t1
MQSNPQGCCYAESYVQSCEARAEQLRGLPAWASALHLDMLCRVEPKFNVQSWGRAAMAKAELKGVCATPAQRQRRNFLWNLPQQIFRVDRASCPDAPPGATALDAASALAAPGEAARRALDGETKLQALFNRLFKHLKGTWHCSVDFAN